MIETRTFEGALEVRGDDGRTLVGVAVPYGQEARIGRYTEVFTRGAFEGTEVATVALTATHPRDGAELPIGRTVTLDDHPDGLHGAWHVPATTLGDEVLALARDGVPLGLSIGFLPLPGGDHWNPTRTRVERRKALLDHVAVVRSGAYPGARVAAVRANQGPATPRLLVARLHARR